jgi:hypothetical protein
MHEYAMRESAEAFRTGLCQRVFATGDPVTGTGEYTSDYTTPGYSSSLSLKAKGGNAEMIRAIRHHNMI